MSDNNNDDKDLFDTVNNASPGIFWLWYVLLILAIVGVLSLFMGAPSV